ncbi:RNA methyltransferase [Streptomyces caniscabiei]|uniref:TrmH family RNA methyltransferase n=1 Tax=Streptomyces caniscabiei TaxID=2746961 RepID=UPI0029B55754|nr:RNA methyltransferase [Streptomyces caniscabiei]MDX2776228.1 RNA methyltransferase [Streptomyces caniscabiei]
MEEAITSVHNPRIKALAKLKKRSERDKQGVFVTEGYRPITRALAAGFHFAELYYSPEWFLGENEPALLKKAEAAGTRLTRIGKEAFLKIAYRERPEGLVAVGSQWHTALTDLTLSNNPFVIVVEAIEKPGNLGTILRSADATGAEAVIVCDAVTDVFNPNVVRASTGVLFTTPTIVTDSKSTIDFLKRNAIKTLAATPAATQVYTDVDMTGPLAIVMGSEQFGLTDLWLDTCDIPVRLPMAGIADSLNVSAATVALAYEVVRQRK